MKRIMMLVAVIAFALVAGACSIDVELNDDGSLQIETVLTEETVQEQFTKGIDDPLVTALTVDMKPGYALVEMERTAESGRGTDTVSFKVELFVDNGHLGVNITNAVWNEIDIPQELVDIWNQELAIELEEEAKEDPNSTLVAVEFTETALNMEFHIETEDSKS